jgi:hypothetical protein
MNNIQPFTKTTTKIITSFKVTCRTLNLFENAIFVVDSFNDTNNFVSRELVTLTNEQYLEWNNNDEYIIKLVAKELGYTLVGPVTSATNIIG